VVWGTLAGLMALAGYQAVTRYRLGGAPPAPDPSGPTFVAQPGVYGFNILANGDGFFAIPQADGAFEEQRFLRHGYSAQFSGRTLGSVRSQVVAAAGAAPRPAAPRLVEQGRRGWNIIACQGRFFAVPQQEGPFDLRKALGDSYRRCLHAASLAEVRDLIDRAGPADTEPGGAAE
jgi:hypothetical protein